MEKIYKYPIKVVSQITGLSVFVIRAWEKRYSAVSPSRTEANRRLYSGEDIEKLKLLHEAKQKGHNIGGIAHLSINELYNVLESKPASVKVNQAKANEDFSDYTFSDINTTINNCIEAIRVYDGKTLEIILLKALSKMSQPQLIENLIVPLIHQVGDLWYTGDIRIANEHLASTVIRSFLANILDRYKFSDNAPIIISATPSGQEHELGALIAGIVAAWFGWNVIYLGPNLPVEEIVAVSENLKAKVVALSIVYPNDDLQLKKDLKNLKRMLSKNISIVVGGRAAGGYIDILDEIEAVVVKDIKILKDELEAIRENKYN